jgi:hypothetical protein
MPVFTAQTARENAAKSHAARRANALAVKEANIALLQPPQSATAIAGVLPDGDAYAGAMLLCTRAQINRLDGMLSKKTDPREIDHLVSAIRKLSEIERQLAGRPLPGSLRPPNKPPTRSGAAFMLDDEGGEP